MENNAPVENRKEDSQEESINLLDFLIVLAKRKKLIIGSTLVVAVITLIMTIPKYPFYEAETTILPPQQQDVNIGRQFMAELGIFPGVGRSPFHNKQELLVEIIKNSRTYSDRLIERFNLVQDFDAEDITEARGKFYENIKIEPDFSDSSRVGFLGNQNSPLMKIRVKNQNPKKAANIANAMVEELKKFINDLALSEAAERRLFFEEQLKQAEDDLIRAEDKMKAFQEKTGVLRVEEQASAVIEKIAGLEAQITAKEVELQVMKSYSTANNPDVQRIEETIKGLRKELAKLEKKEMNTGDLFIPTGMMASLGLDYKRMFRELKFNEARYEIMLKQYEIAKVEESKDSVVIQVVDPAVPPTEEEQKSVRIFGRKKALALTMFTFFASCLLAFFLEYREKSGSNMKVNPKLQTLMGYLSFKRIK